MADKKKAATEKPLDRMTVKELREIAKQIDGITGVHGMNKGDLLVAIKEVRGIKDEPKKKAGGSVREIKSSIKALKIKRKEALSAKNKDQATILKRKISKLKKKSRRAT